ncbi:MAG: SGNH/GDSL hydrolase family protein [Verrucomicrobiota bacterium]
MNPTKPWFGATRLLLLLALFVGACATTKQPPEPRAAATAARTPSAEASKGRVLFLGDSFSIGAFGRTFDQSLRDAGYEVYTSIAGGGTPYYWLREYPPVSINISYWERTPNTERRLSSIAAVPKVETLMAKWKPDIVVVQSGTNLYAPLRSSRHSKEHNIQRVETLIAKMCRAITAGGGAQCYWITPPDASTEKYPRQLQEEMLRTIRRGVSGYGRVFNSYAVTTYPQSQPSSDGIHLAPNEARNWANRAANDFLKTY